jgi:hypothetical protein
MFGGLVANLDVLVDRVRQELGDLPQSFVQELQADGDRDRFALEYSPLDGPTLSVRVRTGNDEVDLSAMVAVEEQTGVLVLPSIPAAGSTVIVSGTHFRYFTTMEVETFISTALEQHAARRTDSLGRLITVETLDGIEEYPVAVYATVLALYTLATDASFDIDIIAPDGVTIPRSERFRQLMQMVEERKKQYEELCVLLGIGMFSIDVFTLRRQSKMTNRMVPIYIAQEVFDRSWPIRADIPMSTYGHKPVEWPNEGGELTAYQTLAFETTVKFSGNWGEEANFFARIVHQRGSVNQLQPFAMELTNDGQGNYEAKLSLTPEQTRFLYKRTYWQILVEPEPGARRTEVIGGKLFTERVMESRG